jgi:hypothetical protein
MRLGALSPPHLRPMVLTIAARACPAQDRTPVLKPSGGMSGCGAFDVGLEPSDVMEGKMGPGAMQGEEDLDITVRRRTGTNRTTWSW